MNGQCVNVCWLIVQVWHSVPLAIYFILENSATVKNRLADCIKISKQFFVKMKYVKKIQCFLYKSLGSRFITVYSRVVIQVRKFWTYWNLCLDNHTTHHPLKWYVCLRFKGYGDHMYFFLVIVEKKKKSKDGRGNYILWQNKRYQFNSIYS